MKKLIYTILLIGLSHSAYSQGTATIKGEIKNGSQKKLQGINIALEGTHYGTATNAEGKYALKQIPASEYTLVVSAVGYQNKKKKITVEADQTVVLDFKLNPSTEALGELTVRGDRTNPYDSSEPSPSLKVATPILKTPQNIQVITGEILDEQQAFNMVENVARNVSGVSRGAHWDNLYARIYMRGSKIPAFRNGLNVEMPWGPLAEDMSMIKQIEVVKGPAGFMMANGEPGGFYNVVTEKPTGHTRASASLTTGSYNTLRATADFEGQITNDNTLLYRINLLGQQKGSHRNFDFNNRYAVAPILTYNFNTQTSLTAEYTYQFSEYHQPGGYVASPDGFATLPRDFSVSDPKIGPSNINDHSLFLTFNHEINKHWQITAKMASFDYRVKGEHVYPRSIDPDGNLTRPLSIWDAHSDSKLGQIFVNGSFDTGPVKHNILGGVDLSEKSYMAVFTTAGQLPKLNIYDPTYNIAPDTIPSYNPSERLNHRANWRQQSSQTAVYIQDELHFWEDRVRLTLAGRFTNSTNKGGFAGGEVQEQVFTPRVGLNISLDDNSSFYALYDESYIPKAGQTYEGNKFEPVSANNIEVGLKRSWFTDKWNSTLSVYRIAKDNVLNADPDHPKFSLQLGQIQTQGIELDLNGRILPGLNLMFNYALTDSEISEDTNEDLVGTATPGTIRHINNSWLSYQQLKGLLKGFGISLGYQWKIDRTSWGGQKLKDYFRLDGGLSWANERLSVNLTVNNILDKYLYVGNYSSYYETYIWITEPPRNFRLKVAYNF